MCNGFQDFASQITRQFTVGQGDAVKAGINPLAFEGLLQVPLGLGLRMARGYFDGDRQFGLFEKSALFSLCSGGAHRLPGTAHCTQHPSTVTTAAAARAAPVFRRTIFLNR